MAAESLLDDLVELPRQHADAAWPLFAKHGVDAVFLDFLVSEAGDAVLRAWRSRGIVRSAGGNAQETADSEPGAGLERQPSEAKKCRGAGRQRISQLDRQHRRHYYADAFSAPATPPIGGRSSAPPPIPPSACATPTRASPAAAVGGLLQRTKLVDAAAARPQGRPPEGRPSPAAGAPCCSGAASGGAAAGATASDSGNDCEGAGEDAEGRIKFFSPTKGYGFITTHDNIKDVHIGRADMPLLEHAEQGHFVGRRVRFKIVLGKDGNPVAQKAEWILPPDGRFEGYVKQGLGPAYGFIKCDKVFAMYERDVYIPSESVPAEARPSVDGEPSEGARLISFSLTHNAKGQPQATDIQLVPQPRPQGVAVGQASRW